MLWVTLLLRTRRLSAKAWMSFSPERSNLALRDLTVKLPTLDRRPLEKDGVWGEIGSTAYGEL
jgi:hypothetical protein